MRDFRQSAYHFWQTPWAIGLLALAAVSLRLLFLDVPFERDEGVYAYISDVIDRGGIPYRDAFDHKPPIIYYLYNISFALFGHTVAAPRITAALFTWVACLFVFAIVLHLTRNRAAAAISMFFLGFSSASPAYSGFGSNTEIFTLPLMTAGAYYLLIARHHLGKFALAGLLFGVAIMIKQVAFLVALCAVIACLLPQFKNTPFLIRASGLFIAGLLLPLAFFNMYFSYHKSFSYFIDYAFYYNISYVNIVTLKDAWRLFYKQAIDISTIDPIIWCVFAVSFVVLWTNYTTSHTRFFVSSLLLGSVLATATGRYFFGHYFIVMLPFLAIAIGTATGLLTHKRAQTVCFSILIATLIASTHYTLSLSQKPYAQLLDEMYPEKTPFYRSPTIGDFLKNAASPNQTVFIIGSEGQILFYAGLRSASSIFYFYPLTMPSSMQPALRKRLAEDLEKTKPNYIVAGTSHGILSHEDPIFNYMMALLQNYHPIGISLHGSETITVGDDMSDILSKGLPENAVVIYAKN